MCAEKTWKAITLIELLLASVVILRDIFIPTLVILVMVVISLLIRREKLSVLGFKKPKSWPVLIGVALASALLLQLFDAGVLMSILNRLTGTTIQYSGFATLKGKSAGVASLSGSFLDPGSFWRRDRLSRLSAKTARRSIWH